MAVMRRTPTQPDWFGEQGPPPDTHPAPTTDFRTGGGPATTPWGTGLGTGPVAPPPTAPAPSGQPAPAPAQGGQQPAGGQYRPYSDQALQDILHKYSPDNAGVRQADAEIQRTFGPGVVKLLDHPERLDKFVTPTGTFDTVVGAGGGNPSWGWMREGAGHGGAGGTGGTLGGLSGVGLSPAGQSFVNMLGQSHGAVGPLLGDPMAGRPITDDPSFGFRMNEGAKALERSAAAKGTLLTGGAAKAMQRYAQDVASTEYANSYARRAAEQGNNYNRLLGAANFMSGEQMNQYNRYLGPAQLGANATAHAQQNASGYAGNIGNAQLGIGGAQAWNTGQQGNANAELFTNLGNIAGQTATDWYKKRAAGRVPTQPGEI